MLAPALILELAALGLCTGFLAGLLGIGGGTVIVPVMTLIMSARGLPPDLTVKIAIATSMGTILFTSMASVRAHHRRGAVRWEIVTRLAPGILLGAIAASLGAFSLLKGTWLALFFSAFITVSATQMLLNRQPASHRTLPGTPGQLGVGGVIGFLSGLVGAGGGFVSVPFMQWCNVPLQQAVATSSALGFPIALANVAGYILSGWNVPDLPPGSLGYIYLPALALIASASVLAAPLGVRVAHALPVHYLRRFFALMLYTLAGYMLWHSLAS